MVLAAGQAIRMGAPKPAMEIGSTTMVRLVIEAAAKADISDVYVVTGFHHKEVSEAVGSSAIVLRNPAPERGNVSSLVVGLNAVPSHSGVIVLLADMPFVKSSDIKKLAAGVSASGRAAGWVEYLDGRGHPVALASSTFEDVKRLSGPKSLWPYFDALSPHDVFVVERGEPKPADVNTRVDYDRLKTQIPNDLPGSD